MDFFKASSLPVFLLHTLLLLKFSCVSLGVESDIQCLMALRRSLIDPSGYLQSWNFSKNNNTDGFICKFLGIVCWHPDESRVLSIHLSNMGLRGQFPSGLENCKSLMGLDLSSNLLSDPIPASISRLIPFVTTLDLSDNKFSGEIPVDLANCRYLNAVSLEGNQLSGQIPGHLSQLNRLSSFNVADNNLSGPIPPFKESIQASSYAGNPGLCGHPLEKCVRSSSSKKTYTSVILGAVTHHTSVILGYVVGVVVGVFLYLLWHQK